MIKAGNVVKNVMGKQDVVLYDPKKVVQSNQNCQKVKKYNTSINNRETVKTGFKCFYTNMQITFNKIKRDELLMYITEHKIYIVGLTETWLQQIDLIVSWIFLVLIYIEEIGTIH